MYIFFSLFFLFVSKQKKKNTRIVVCVQVSCQSAREHFLMYDLIDGAIGQPPVTNDCNAFIRKCNVRPGPRCQGQFGVLSSLLCVGAGYSDNPNKRLRDDKRAKYLLDQL